MIKIATANKNPVIAYFNTGDTKFLNDSLASKYTPTIIPVTNQNANFK